MGTVFISGSRSVRMLATEVQDRLGGVLQRQHKIVVGDSSGVDTLAQEYLLNKGYPSVTVYHSGKVPRNNLGGWPTRCIDTEGAPEGTRSYHTFKDIQMAQDADFGFLVWDGHSKGTLANAHCLLRQAKWTLAYLAARNRFFEIGSRRQLDEMVRMAWGDKRNE